MTNRRRATVGLLAAVAVLLALNLSDLGAQAPARRAKWEYARWVHAGGVSIWEARDKEQYGTLPYDTYKALGGRKPKSEWAKPGEKAAVWNQAGRLGWELCGVDTEGSTVYYFKRRAN